MRVRLESLIAALLLSGGVLYPSTATAYLTLVDTFENPSAPPSAGAISPDGANIYATLLLGTLAVLRRDSATGSLSFLQLLSEAEDVKSFARDVVVSPDGRNVYTRPYSIGSSDTRFVIFRRDASTGSLTLGEIDPDGGEIMSPDGKFAYGATTSGITTFARDAASGGFSLVHSATPEGAPFIVSLDGATLYASASGGVASGGMVLAADLLVYARDGVTGGLTLIQRIALGDLGYVRGVFFDAVALSPDGRTIYFGTYDRRNPLFVYNRSLGDGTLTLVQRVGPVGTPPVPAAPSLFVSPDGGVLYVGGDLVLHRSAVTGRVDPVPVESDGGGPPMVESPDGRDVYAVDGHNNVRHMRRTCGNGVIDPGEACDDGGLSDGDGCSSACTVEPCWSCTGSPSQCITTADASCDDGNPCTSGDTCVAGTCTGTALPDGSPCEDGDACTSGDTCAAGACVGGATLACGPCEQCDYDAGCLGVRYLDCVFSPGDGRYGGFDIRNTKGHHRGFSWTFVGERDVDASGFPDPRTTPYTFCAFDDVEPEEGGLTLVAHPVLQMTLPTNGSCARGRPCWVARRSGGFHLRGVPHADVTSANLTPAPAEQPAITMGGRAVPTKLPLGTDQNVPTVSVQLRAGNACWSAEYSIFIDRNTPRRFDAQTGSCPRSGCGGGDARSEAPPNRLPLR